VTSDIRTAGRIAVPWDAITADGIDNTITNTSEIDLGNADSDATVTHAALMDDDTAGNDLVSHAVTGGPLTVVAGAACSFAPGALVFGPIGS
jgi:hypothetical protein